MISAIACIATAIYFEARSEPIDGQVAVANVIVNRVRSEQFPDDPCGVVTQGKYWSGHPVRNACHWSFYCDGLPERITDQGAYTLALSIAIHAQTSLVDVTGGATYYHRDDVDPYWVSGLTNTRTIGRHIFYSED